MNYKYSCINCKYYTNKKYDFERHNKTIKHFKNTERYKCNKCDYITTKKCNYDRHMKSSKHTDIKNVEVNNIDSKKDEVEFCCKNCNKSFNSRSGLWYHNKKCKKRETVITNKIIDINNGEMVSELISGLMTKLKESNDDLIMKLVESNNKVLMDTIPKLSQTKNINSNNTTNNMTINMYLNEYCKDAMNLTEFVKTLNITENDIKNTGNVGFVQGILSIMMNKLVSMKYTERPLHCTDVKRSKFYIKDNDKWERDDKNVKIKKLLKDITQKQFDTLCFWVKNNMEEAMEDDKVYSMYENMYSNISMNIDGKMKDILRKLCGLTKIDKELMIR